MGMRAYAAFLEKNDRYPRVANVWSKGCEWLCWGTGETFMALHFCACWAACVDFVEEQQCMEMFLLCPSSSRWCIFLEGHQSRSTGTVEESMFSAKEEQWSCCVFPAIPVSLPFPTPSAASVLYHYSVRVLALWIDISFYAGRHSCLDKGCPEICRKTSAGFTFFPWKDASTVLVLDRNLWALIYWALYSSMWIMKLNEKLQVICT